MCGYVLAALDSRSFYDQFVTEWAPEVAKRYPLPHVGIKELTPEEVCTYKRTNVCKLVFCLVDCCHIRHTLPYYSVTCSEG